LVGTYDEKLPADFERLSDYMTGRATLPSFSGDVQVTEGRIDSDITLIHSRSVAEGVMVTKARAPYTGTLRFLNGRFARHDDSIIITGKSLLHSAPLTVE